MLGLKDRLREIRKTIARAPSAQKPVLVAVSKGQSLGKIRELYHLGQRDFGENYVQEWHEKATSLQKGCPEIRWHFLGQIQSKKLGDISKADFLHSLGSLQHAQKLSKILEKVSKKMPVFLQVNLGEEPQKAGFRPSEFLEDFEGLNLLPGLDIVGLMILPPKSLNPDFWFEKAVELKTKIESLGLIKKLQLSMGMSRDFESAIRHGANYVRVGEALFGPRERIG